MKKCPTCQKEYADSMRFCQIDGTVLTEVKASEPEDPFKTIVGGSGGNNDPFKTVVGGIKPPERDEDLPNFPQPPADPMKTMVVSPEEFKKELESASAKPEEKPKTDLNPPSFGDLTPKSPEKPNDIFGSGNPPSEKSPFGSPSDSPFGQPPAATPFGEEKSSYDAPKQSPFDSPGTSPYGQPSSAPFGNQSNSPFDNSPFAQPQSPFGNQQANDPFGAQNDWTPPPAPVGQWQDQGINANTPFQPPVAAGGQNNTLAIVSLVCGILSICLCGLLTGIPAIITGFMAKKNIDSNPNAYGGRGMAIAGMILGGLSIVFTIIYIIFVVASGGFGR